ncbi:MAG TPA: hypothetical protein VF219_15690, partial [Vicinamibacterales bacterium]
MIIGVPLDVVVRRTARVRLGVTVAGCEIAVLRTARVREDVEFVITGLIVDAEVTVVPLPLLLIIVGSIAADGIVRFPIARVRLVDGTVAAAA